MLWFHRHRRLAAVIITLASLSLLLPMLLGQL